MKKAIARRSSAARASLQRIRFSFTRKADGEIYSEDARRIVDPRSISLRAIGAPRRGATIQALRTRANGTLQGRVPYVGVPITFESGKDADPKPRQDWITEDVAEHKILALTKNLPHAQFYLCLLDKEDIGKEFQGTFVSQARKCRFQDLVAALEDHFGQDADTAFVWLDLFCANQPLLTSADEDLPPKVVSAQNQYLTHGLHRAIGRFGRAVIFFGRWDVPAPLQRAWCVWEIMGAITQAQNFEVVITPGQEQAFVEALLADVHGLAKIMADNNSMRNAECWKKGDKEMMDKAIEVIVDGGYVTLIKEVNRHVHAWRLKMARDAVLEARSGDGHVRKLALILGCTGQLLKSQGEYIEALQMLEEALSIRKESLGDRYLDVAATLHKIAGAYGSQGRYEEALA
ncbi:Kinesin light chain [Hondaea fermentalgiana]|uniref:Kinesin light chain n=1 Tax=Hondaea fermentalgiana TaxID=2315210 RepID=A0A2R5GD49_9STRA|nr:Kinesin light chain [Hondaea fermentalgiana]|eukprot:GBG26081.1 Kinesin light chain [Hondaea fermentalgiana]